MAVYGVGERALGCESHGPEFQMIPVLPSQPQKKHRVSVVLHPRPWKDDEGIISTRQSRREEHTRQTVGESLAGRLLEGGHSKNMVFLHLWTLNTFRAGVSNLLASLRHTGGRVVLGHTLNTLRCVITKKLIVF